MAQEHIPNDQPLRSFGHEALELMKVSLKHVLKTTPPQSTCGVHEMLGDIQVAQLASPTYFFDWRTFIHMSRLQATL